MAFLDDDDEWLPTKTETQVLKLESAPEITKASIAGNIKITPDGEILTKYIPSRPDDIVAYQLCWNIGTFSMLVVHEEVCDTIGGLDNSLDRHEDKDFLLRIARNFDFDIVKQPLVRKGVGRDDHLGEDYDAARRAKRIFSSKHENLAKEKNRYGEMMNALEFSLGRSALDNKDYAKARRHFAKSLYYDPFNIEILQIFFAALGGPVTHRFGKWLSKRL